MNGVTGKIKPARRNDTRILLCYHSGSMKQRRQLFGYILINIFISAVVTGTLIFFYNRVRPATCDPAAAGVAVPAGTDGIHVSISGVSGAGTLAQEHAVIQNDGTQELVLTGWTLENNKNKGARYTFPALTLHPGARVQVHTTAGRNTPTNLYWGLSAPAWSSGDLAALYDAQNIARAFYRVP